MHYIPRQKIYNKAVGISSIFIMAFYQACSITQAWHYKVQSNPSFKQMHVDIHMHDLPYCITTAMHQCMFMFL